MLFYSKGNYSFISDGKLTIDNGLDGADMDFNGDVRITTNDNNTFILGGAGEIYLNTEETTEPLARGQTLIDIMAELCDAINAQIFSTPSGPTMTGPNNRGDFNKIKPESQIELINLFSNMVGHKGMVGGQAKDIRSSHSDTLTLSDLLIIYKMKGFYFIWLAISSSQ